MFRLKLCGVTCVEDALHAAAVGFDALGLILCPSRRRIDLEVAERISREVKGEVGGSVKIFAVVFNPSATEVDMLCSAGIFDGLQVYGERGARLAKEAGLLVVKAVFVSGAEDVKGASVLSEGFDMVLFDAPKGGKAPFDWALLRGYKGPLPFGVAGGISPDNLHLLREIRPYGVDVCSSVELYPGKKDPEKVRELAERFRLTLEGLR